MRTIKTKVYLIDEHPAKDKCFEWMRSNMHDLNQHSVDGLIQSLKELSYRIGGGMDYSISQVPDRGEFIRFWDYDKGILSELDANECPLTGVFWDAEVIEAMESDDMEVILDILHSVTEHAYSNEGLTELCNVNEFEFKENGELY